MPAFLEAKLKREYPNNPGAVYGTLNKLGAMKGSRETPKGEAMQRKHDAQLRAGIGLAPGKRASVRNMAKKRK